MARKAAKTALGDEPEAPKRAKKPTGSYTNAALAAHHAAKKEKDALL